MTPAQRQPHVVLGGGSWGTTTVDDAYRGLAAEKPGHEVHGAGF